MNISAALIQKSTVSNRVIEQETKAILASIQAEIIEASKNGVNNVIIPMPTNFNVAGITNMAAQTIIYNKIIKECESRGFVVKIRMLSGSVSYHISWNIEGNESDLKKMRDNIASHIIH